MGHKGAHMGRDGRRNRLIIWLAGAGYLVALALIAAWPSPVDAPVNAQLMAFFDALHRRGVPQIIGYNLLEFGANVVLFIPCGLLLAHLLRSWVPAVLLGAGLAVAIEAGQWLVLPGRHADARDIIANSAGALFGALLWLLLRTLHRRRSTARSRTEYARRARRS